MDATETDLGSQRCFLYTEAQLGKKVGEKTSRYKLLVQGLRESDDQSLKLETLETLICLQVQFGPQLDERMPKIIRVYCEDMDLDYKAAEEAIYLIIVKRFGPWIASKWPFDL